MKMSQPLTRDRILWFMNEGIGEATAAEAIELCKIALASLSATQMSNEPPEPQTPATDHPKRVKSDLEEAGYIRICPERDGRCPHGVGCPYPKDRYGCDIEASRKALRR